MLNTRPAKPADEDRVMDLLAQLMEDAPIREEILRPGFRRLLEEPTRGAALVAEDETGVLGVITFSYNFAVRFGGFYAQIEELCVDSEARGKNGGATLVQACIATAREHGCKEIGLYSREHTRAFYEKQGFAYAGPEVRQPL